MGQTQQIERLERLREWSVLAIWSPGLWLMLPLIIMVQASSLWSPSNRVLDVLGNIWTIGLLFLLVLCVIGAFAMTKVRGRIEALCRELDGALPTCVVPQTGPIRVRASSPSTLIVVRHFAPLPVRWIINSWVSVLCLTFMIETLRSWPVTGRNLTDLLITLMVLAIFFGPAWLFATWTWATHVKHDGHQLRISRRSGPWAFGPIRTRVVVIPVPCAAQIGSTGFFVAGTDQLALITRLPRSKYGYWLGLRLRAWLEELLHVPLPLQE